MHRSPDFANIPLFVDTQLGTMQKENGNVALLPSCPSDGWETLHPLTPRPGYQWTAGLCETEDGGLDTCPHDVHYYGAPSPFLLPPLVTECCSAVLLPPLVA